MNAAFTALLGEVYTITNRPDLEAETSMAVRAATLKLHHIDFFPRDLVEQHVVFDAADYFQVLAYKDLFARFRALSYARKYENGDATQFLKVITPTDLFDGYGYTKENVCYLAGEVIQIRSHTEISELLVGYYQNPLTVPDDYSSWINDLYPFAIITEAAAAVFKMIGKDEENSLYRQMAAEHAQIVRNSNITAEAF